MGKKDEIIQGIEHHGKGRYGKAEKYFRKAVESDPENIAAYNNLALTLAEKGEREEAIKVLKKALKKCEHDRGFYVTLKNNLKMISDGTKAPKQEKQVD